HDVYRIGGFDPDIIYHRRNFRGCTTGVFRQPLNLFRYHREAFTGLTRRSSVHTRVQGEDVSTFRDGVNQVNDTGNFLRAVPETLDTLLRFRDGAADCLNTLNGFGYRRLRLHGTVNGGCSNAVGNT